MSSLLPRNRDPFSPLANIQERMNILFDSFFDQQFPSLSMGLSSNYPAIEVIEKDNSVCIKAEIPSIDEKNIKLDINKNYLTISGEKRSESKEENKTYYMSEITYGKFSRSIVLPFEIDPNKAKASFSKGVLTVEIEKPKDQITKTQSIPISFER